MNKNDIIKELEQDEQYKTLLESVPEDQKQIVKDGVEQFVENFSRNILSAFSQVADSPEATQEFIKELNKLYRNAT